MMRRFAAACVAAAVSATLFLGPAAGVFAESTAESTASEAPGEVLSSVSEAVSTKSQTEIDLDEELEDIDMNELQKNLDAIQKLLASEELQNLLKYDEVQDLLKTSIDKVLEFTQEEPELTQKILTVFGLEEPYVRLIMKSLSILTKAKEDLKAFLESEEGQEVQKTVVMLLNNPAVLEQLMDINETLGQYIGPSDSMGQGTEQPAQVISDAEPIDGGASDNG